MAAGQRKKRLNGASVIRLNFHEHHVGRKKMKLASSDILLNMASHASLEWDDSQNKVVARREQIGLMWRDMSPFLEHVPRCRTGLADVLSVPQEIFELENITDVLSYEVWGNSLSKQERNLLIQFLPIDADADNVVRSLLAGENFHFGNPFCKWGVSLCAGNLHPDGLPHMEQQLRTSRNSYFSQLKKYHSQIIKNLSKLKESLTNCKNLENEMDAKIWRETTTNSTNGSPLMAPGNIQVLSSSQKEQTQNTCFHYGDTAKYMSYIKINKKQHQLVKNINHSSDGIQSKCLNRVLGDIKGFNIQPYAAFEEEERKRLHEHWLQLARKDLPAALENHRECRSLRDKWRKSVQHELEEKEVTIKDEERENLRCSPKQVDDRESEQDSSLDTPAEGYVRPVHFNDSDLLEGSPSINHDQELSPTSTFSDQEHNLDAFEPTNTHPVNHSTDNCHLEKMPVLSGSQEHNPSAVDLVNENIVESATTSPTLSINGHEDVADTMESKASSIHGHHLERIPSLNGQIESTADMQEDGNQDLIKCTENSPIVTQFLQCMGTADIVKEKHSVSFPEDIWQSGSTSQLYHHYTSENQVCRSASELALQQSQPMEEQSTHLIDLEAQILDQGAAESIASAMHVSNRAAMFSSNANQNHNLLLPPSHEQGILPSYLQKHLNESKQSGLQVLVTNDGLRQSQQFPHLFQEQQELLRQNQAREKELYMQPILNGTTHSSGRYPSRGHFLSVGTHHWANFESTANGGLVGNNWFTAENDTRNSWSGAEPTDILGQCPGDACSADGSLFSVLSKCNKLPSHSPFVTTSPEGFLPGGNFIGGSNPHSDGTYAHLVNNASGRDAASLKTESMPWMNFSLHNHRP